MITLSPSQWLATVRGDDPTAIVRLAVVTATSPYLLVQFEGDDDPDSVPKAWDAGYTPGLADRVWCVKIGKAWLVVNSITGP